MRHGVDKLGWCAGRVPSNSVGDADGVGCGDEDAMASVVVERGPEVKTLDPVWSPGFSFVGGVEGEDKASRRGNGLGIEGICTVKSGPGGYARVGGAGTKEVERYFSVRDEVMPGVKWEMHIRGCQSGHEMVFEVGSTAGVNGLGVNVSGVVVEEHHEVEGSAVCANRPSSSEIGVARVSEEDVDGVGVCRFSEGFAVRKMLRSGVCRPSGVEALPNAVKVAFGRCDGEWRVFAE